MSNYFSKILDGDYEQADKIRRIETPPKLVKFFSLDGEKEHDEKRFLSLQNQQLWFTKSYILNDPYEFQNMYIGQSKKYPPELISQCHFFLDELKQEFALISLSGNSVDCLPMWAYYANNYKGFCVEYNVVDPKIIFPVTYVEKRVDISRLIIPYLRRYAVDNYSLEDIQLDQIVSNFVLQQLLLKHISWKHENEYRIFLSVPNADGKNEEISKTGLRTSRIIAGHNCSTEHKKRLNEISNKLGCGDCLSTTINGENYLLLNR